MRKLIATEFMTLDGVFEAPEEWSFQFFSEEAGTYKFEELQATGALLLGRVTYEGFAQAWPTRNDEQGFADRMNSLPKYVVSTTLDKAEWNNTTVIKGDVVDEVSRLKEQPGQDIVIHGSAELVNSLMPHDLIDEYRLMVSPIVLGKGKRLFQGGSDSTVLDLAETTTTGTGVAILTYRRATA